MQLFQKMFFKEKQNSFSLIRIFLSSNTCEAFTHSIQFLGSGKLFFFFFLTGPCFLAKRCIDCNVCTTTEPTIRLILHCLVYLREKASTGRFLVVWFKKIVENGHFFLLQMSRFLLIKHIIMPIFLFFFLEMSRFLWLIDYIMWLHENIFFIFFFKWK